MTWIYAFYSFEYKWINKGWTLEKRIDYFEERWAYFIGFGKDLDFSSSFFFFFSDILIIFFLLLRRILFYIFLSLILVSFCWPCFLDFLFETFKILGIKKGLPCTLCTFFFPQFISGGIFAMLFPMVYFRQQFFLFFS